MKLLLASQSPRRKQLLTEMGIHFECVQVECDEVFPENLSPELVASYLSKLKAKAFRNLAKNEILLTADTIVVCDNEILGKPKDRVEAINMLHKISHNHHYVYTAFTLKTIEFEKTQTDVAKVYFKKMMEADVLKYVDVNKPFDKAGGYGIQEWIGMAYMEKMEGSFYTIMGLPTHLVYEALKEIYLNLKQ